MKIKRTKGKTKNQKKYIELIHKSTIVLCTGCSGTGKTAVATRIGCEYLLDGKVDTLIITRPMIETGNKGIGFLPGNLNDKIVPYLTPVITEIKDFLPDKNSYNDLYSQKKIQIIPLEMMRGYNLHKCYVVADEMQNATYEQIKMLMTRVGNNTKMVINGDVEQTDLYSNEKGGLFKCIDRLHGIDEIGIIELGVEDIVRNELIKIILTRLT